MRRVLVYAVVCLALLAFGLPLAAIGAAEVEEPEAGQSFVSGDFTVQFWKETFSGGGPGQPGNTLQARGEDFDLKDAVLESVVPLGDDQYETTYVGGKLHLKKKGPWGEDLKASNVTLLNTSTFNNDTGELSFDIQFCGQFDPKGKGKGKKGGEEPEGLYFMGEATYDGYPQILMEDGVPIWQKGFPPEFQVTITIGGEELCPAEDPQ